MARPISMDLRKRAMERLDRGQTVRQVAAVLDVAPSSVVKWPQRRRRTGSCAPGRPGGRRPRKISGEHEAWLLGRIKDAFTLRGLVGELAGRGVRVDYRTVWNAVHRAGYSFKKKNAEAHRAVAGGCGTAQGPPEASSEADRPEPARLHRRNLGQDQHGTVARLGTQG